uniref:Uncharacterized protein n=1 Tax=Amphimedon queenslandica TaxID=400682 RepID=A0A1X7TN03_AMPQE
SLLAMTELSFISEQTDLNVAPALNENESNLYSPFIAIGTPSSNDRGFPFFHLSVDSSAIFIVSSSLVSMNALNGGERELEALTHSRTTLATSTGSILPDLYAAQ